LSFRKNCKVFRSIFFIFIFFNNFIKAVMSFLCNLWNMSLFRVECESHVFDSRTNDCHRLNFSLFEECLFFLDLLFLFFSEFVPDADPVHDVFGDEGEDDEEDDQEVEGGDDHCLPEVLVELGNELQIAF